MARGGQRGEQVPNACLTDAQAEEARQRFAAGGVTIAQLAALYGCRYLTMWRVVNYVTYLGENLTNA